MIFQSDFSGEKICKLCGNVIRSCVPCDHCGKETPFFMKNNLYCEIEMTMEDGSTHTTNMCINCAKKMDIETLNQIYLADMKYANMDNSRYTKRKVKSYSIAR